MAVNRAIRKRGKRNVSLNKKAIKPAEIGSSVAVIVARVERM